MSSQSILCPNCKHPIAIEEALTHQIQEELGIEFEKKLKIKDKEIETVKQAVHTELAAAFEVEKQQTILETKRKASQEMEGKLKLLEQENQSQEKKLEEARKSELEVRKLMNKLEDDKRAFELDKQRQLDEERKNIRETVERKMAEEQHYKDLEKEKVISDLRKALDDARRKAEQGSQQTQGEVIELELEETLRFAFPQDKIEAIGKGVHGADIRQIVCSPRGSVCGTILWESKQTKRWDEKWIGKLKEDLRAEKADIAAIVTATYTETEWKGIVHHEGVWVCSLALILPLAMLLRKALLDVGYQKAVSAHRGEKADLLYEYITGHEFRQQIEALIEVFNEMQEQVFKERASLEKSWKQRESQIKRLYMSAASIFGSIQGLAGPAAVPGLKGLDALELPE